MRAIHWIRSRQESEELSYWTSFVYFDPKDRSFNNRIYLVYLLIFFSVWWFIVIIWFAEAGAMLMTTIYPSSPVSLAVALVLVVILVWFVVSMIQFLRRSPVKFSAEDAHLVCQMPLNPQKLVLRWLAMPWFKSLVLFLLLAIVLAFSLARTELIESRITGQDLGGYFRLGFRAVLGMVPLHLALYSLSWALAVWFMKHQRKMGALLVVLAICLVVLVSMGSGIAATFNANLPCEFKALGSVMADGLRIGFSEGSLGSVLMVHWAAALIALVMLFFAAKGFSCSRAAQETREEVLQRNLRRYGFGESAQEKKVQRRLKLDRRAVWLPAWQGAPSFVWKDVLQSWRTVTLGKAFVLLGFFGAAVGLAILPSLSGRMLLILTWTLQASEFLTDRVRQDLAHWAIVRQLPIEHQRWIAADLALSGGIVMLISLIGLGLGGVILGQFPLVEALALPGMIAAVAGVSTFVVFRNARVDLLMSGQAPGVNEIGVIGGAVCAATPLIIYGWLPGLVGVLSAVLASGLIGYLALNIAMSGYRSIE